MTVNDLRALYDYCYWANARLFDVISRLTTEQFTRNLSGSYGSIRNTMVHMMSTEWGWLERCGGPKRGPRLNAADFPDFASVTRQWKQVESQIRGFLAAQRDEDFDRDMVEFALGAGPAQTLTIGQMMHHAAVHGVHHRGQIALLLRELGYSPGDCDILFYYAETRR